MSLNEISLKNLYRLLTVRDYPIYSNGVIPAKSRKGITLVSFWQNVLVADWKNSPGGRKIWSSASRSRYLSDLCNRKGDFPFWEEYQTEIGKSLTPELFLEQMNNIEGYLLSASYDADVFYRKILLLIDRKEDRPSADQEFILINYLKQNRGTVPDSFADSWIFTLLTVLAMSRNDAKAEEFMRIFRQKEYRLPSLWQVKINRTEMTLPLKRRSGEVWGTPEDLAMFFGREQELFDLSEAVRTGRKIFVSGIGGIGKTELLRQLLHGYAEKRGFRNVISVQYDGSLKESLVNAFLQPEGEDLSEKCHDCLYRIKQVKDGSILLLIDNARILEDEIPLWQEVAELDCPVVVTSRESALDGYDCMPIGSLNENAALLMLRRHYDSVLDDLRKDALSGIIEKNELLRHPLTIRLVAEAANRRHWDIEKMSELFRRGSGESELGDLYPEFHWIYRTLYNPDSLPADQQSYLWLLAALPYEQFTGSQLTDLVAPDAEPVSAKNILTELKRKGWIENKGNTWSMHPLISECILENGLEERRVALFLKRAEQILASDPEAVLQEGAFDPAHTELHRYVVSAARHLTGKISDAAGRQILCSMVTLLEEGMTGKGKGKTALQTLHNMQSPSNILKLLTDHFMFRIREFPPFDEAFSRLQDYMAAGDVSEDALIILCCDILMNSIYYDFSKENSMKVLQIMDSIALSPVSRMQFYTMKYGYYVEQLQAEEAMETFDLLWDVYTSVPESERDVSLRAKAKYAALNRGKLDVLMQNAGEARKRLESADKISLPRDSEPIRITRMELYAKILRLEGNTEAAICAFREVAEQMKKLFGDKDLDYLTIRGELAIDLNRSGQSLEAAEIYNECINAYRGRYKDPNRLQIWLNNLGVALTDAGQPQKAVESLLESMELAEGMPEIAKAEASNNLGKAYRKIGDTALELECLQMAEPVFTAFYGPDHPRTLYVKERLKCLSGKEPGDRQALK